MSRDRLAGIRAGKSQYEPISMEGDAINMSVFGNEITSIQESINAYSANVKRISELQTRALSSADENATRRNAAALDALTEETSALANDLKKRIKFLEAQGGQDRDGQVRRQQAGRLKRNFAEVLEQYQLSEQQYRVKYKDRIARQLKIVNPNSTQEDVDALINDPNGGQVFQQALVDSNRYGESRAAYREVQDRHADIQRIERTLIELAQLFSDMAVLVKSGDDSLAVIDQNAFDTESNMRDGLKEVEGARQHAENARRNRKRCFWITIIIILVLALILGLYFGIPAINAANAVKQVHN